MNLEQQIIKDIDTLVPRPDIALDVMALAHCKKCDVKALANKIEQDPSLTANILKIANSSYFGHMKKINTLQDVIVRLGIESIKLLAIGGASIGMLQTPQKAYDLDPGALWNHSYATAILSSIIGKYANHDNTALLYCAGLLHDIGKIVLNKLLLRKFAEGVTYDPDADIITIENDILNTNHSKIGMLLLDKWGLHKNITLPVGHHHDNNILKDGNLECKIVYMANFLSNNIGILATDQDDCFHKTTLYENDVDFSIIPGLKDNMEEIISEFHTKYTE